MNHNTACYSRSTERALTRAALAVLLAALIGLPAGAGARTADREQPADIEAGRFRDDPEAGVRIFSEGVVLRQGTLVVHATEARLRVNDAGEMVRVQLSGSPATWVEQLDDGGQLDAQAERIDYAFADERVVLEGDVIVDRGTDRITGDRIRYDLKTSRLDAGGGEGRVRMRITPPARTSESDDGAQ